jgi:hypothetical protein
MESTVFDESSNYVTIRFNEGPNIVTNLIKNTKFPKIKSFASQLSIDIIKDGRNELFKKFQSSDVGLLLNGLKKLEDKKKLLDFVLSELDPIIAIFKDPEQSVPNRITTDDMYKSSELFYNLFIILVDEIFIPKVTPKHENFYQGNGSNMQPQLPNAPMGTVPVMGTMVNLSPPGMEVWVPGAPSPMPVQGYAYAPWAQPQMGTPSYESTPYNGHSNIGVSIVEVPNERTRGNHNNRNRTMPQLQAPQPPNNGEYGSMVSYRAPDNNNNQYGQTSSSNGGHGNGYSSQPNFNSYSRSHWSNGTYKNAPQLTNELIDTINFSNKLSNLILKNFNINGPSGSQATDIGHGSLGVLQLVAEQAIGYKQAGVGNPRFCRSSGLSPAFFASLAKNMASSSTNVEGLSKKPVLQPIIEQQPVENDTDFDFSFKEYLNKDYLKEESGISINGARAASCSSHPLIDIEVYSEECVVEEFPTPPMIPQIPICKAEDFPSPPTHAVGIDGFPSVPHGRSKNSLFFFANTSKI